MWASLARGAAAGAQAHEGMWMPQQLPLVAKDMKALGLKFDPARLSQPLGYPMGAVVSLGGNNSGTLCCPDARKRSRTGRQEPIQQNDRNIRSASGR